MDSQLELERQRQAAYRRLGTTDPRCVICGEDHWRCLELHHLAGQAYDGLTGIVCRNCHRKLSAPWANAPNPTEPPLMERAGKFVIGLAEFLSALIERMRQYGAQLLQGAAICPWPYGWVGAPIGG